MATDNKAKQVCKFFGTHDYLRQAKSIDKLQRIFDEVESDRPKSVDGHYTITLEFTVADNE